AGAGFSVDGDLSATARPVRRREKNAFLDVGLSSRRFEEPASSVWQNAKHGTAFADALQAHIRMDVEAQSEGVTFDGLVCLSGGAQMIGSSERLAVLAQQNAALMD